MTPDLATQHFEALRVFHLDHATLNLTSFNTEVWLPGEIKVASCRFVPQAHRHVHTKPEKDCTCGIWSCKTRKALVRVSKQWFVPYGQRSKYPLMISARIELWGVVIEHEDGYRSEFARIIPDTIQVFPRNRLNKRYDRLIAYLREKYDPRPA